MPLDSIRIPIPRPRPTTGGIALGLILATIIVISAIDLSKQIYLMSWMSEHNHGESSGFTIEFGRETHRISWLPILLYTSPHHQLAVAASILNIVMSIAVMGLFNISCHMRKNFGQHWFLIAIFIPTIALMTTALLYNFIEHGITDRVNLYYLSQANSNSGRFAHYGAAWLDFESWSCALAPLASNERRLWGYNCQESQLARWLLLPTWFAVVIATIVSWLAFRGLPGWRGNEVEEYVVEGGEGRVRLT